MAETRLIDHLSGKLGIENKSLIEKDFILHSILVKLQEDKNFSKNYIFKGGTCLVKCYLGYYRFSEDLDFTYLNQGLFKDMGKKDLRNAISKEIDKLGRLFMKICGDIGMDFKSKRNDKRYFEYGGGNRFLTLKLWYHSLIEKKEQFIKIQVNFVELLKYKTKRLEARNLLNVADEKELTFLFPEYAATLLARPKILAYDLREILLEKIRAILTRKGTKARDFVDVFLILKHLGRDIEDFEGDIAAKVRFMLKFEKYAANLEEKSRQASWIRVGEEKYLLLKEIYGYEKFIKEFDVFLKRIAKELIKQHLGDSK